MRKSYYASPILAASVLAVGLPLSASAQAAPLTGPVPATYPWCELDLFCYDDDIDIVLNPRTEREDVEYGGGAAFGTDDDDN